MLSTGSLFSLDAVMLLHCLEVSPDRTWWNPSTEDISISKKISLKDEDKMWIKPLFITSIDTFFLRDKFKLSEKIHI